MSDMATLIIIFAYNTAELKTTLLALFILCNLPINIVCVFESDRSIISRNNRFCKSNVSSMNYN